MNLNDLLSGNDELREVMAELGLGDVNVVPMYDRQQVRRRQPQMWDCKDGWVIAYNPHKLPNGKWEVAAYKPIKKIEGRWERVYHREFSKRKTAKARAVKLYADHQGKAWREKNAWWLFDQYGITVK